MHFDRAFFIGNEFYIFTGNAYFRKDIKWRFFD